MSVNKADLVAKVATLSGMTQSAAAKATDAFIAAVTSTLQEGNDVRLVGFGSFSVQSRPARVGKNPRTGAKLDIPARAVPRFTAGKALKDALNR